MNTPYDNPTPEDRPAVRSLLFGLAVIALIAAAVFFYFRGEEQADDPLEAPPMESEHEPLVRHPIPEPRRDPDPEIEEAEEEPSRLAAVLPASLPELNRSDRALLTVAEHMISNPKLAELLVSRDLIRRFVVSVDNLTGRTVPPNHRPIEAPDSRFLVNREGDRITIDPRNYARYQRHVTLLDELDSRDIVEAYVHFYPLFQQAYRELGYPQGFFNDRLIMVIDDLLKTPEINDPIELEQPLVLYVYADDDIEALSAGQRLLLRTGPDNAWTIKRKLEEIREKLVR